MRTILATLDFSDVTSSLLEAAGRCAGDNHVLRLLHVADEDPDFVTYRVGPDEERESVAAELHELRDRIHTQADRLRAEGIEVDSLVVQGLPADRILEEAQRCDAALIVMGRHKHGRLHDLLVGSVAESVLRSATCPVLIVPPAEDVQP